MYAFILSLLMCLFAPSGKTAHPIHLCKALVEYNEKEQAWQISMHIFLDDLEDALRRQGADKLYLCSTKEVPEAEKALSRYLNQHLHLEIDGKPVNCELLGKELSEDSLAVWCYLEVPNVKSTKTLRISSSLLMEVYDDQKNLIHVSGPGGKQGALFFSKGDQPVVLRF